MGIFTPIFYEKNPILPTPLFQILSACPFPNPTFLSPPTPTPTVLSIALLLWLNGWSRHIWCAILFGDNSGSTHVEHCYLSTRRTLICVLCNKRQVYWGLAHNVVFHWYSHLISHTDKHTNTYSTLRGQQTDTPI